MRQTRVMRVLSLGVVFLAVAMAFPAAGIAGAPEKLDCAGEIEWDVAKEAEIVSFACKIGEHKKDPALIFTAEVKNISDKPLRFRLGVYLLDMDKAAGHLIPRKGKPPVVEPGKTETVKIPFIKTDTPSKNMLVVVKTMG